MQPFATDFDREDVASGRAGPDLIDTIILYAKKHGISKRRIASMTGIERVRVQRILCSSRALRYEARTSELERIIKAVGMSSYDALVSAEISQVIDENPEVMTLMPFLSNMLNGLVAEIATEIQSTDGILLGSCKTIHGEVLRKRIVKLVAQELRRYFERQDAARADMEEGSARIKIL